MRIGSAVAATAAVLLAACSSEPQSRVIAPSSTPATRAAAMAILSGDNQNGKAGESLDAPLVIRVTDARGAGVQRAAVTFEISGAGGLNGKRSPGVSRVTTETGADGTAKAYLEAYDVGRISVAARVEGTSLAPVTFTADVAVVVVEFRSPDAVGPYAAFWGPCRCTRTLNTVAVPVGTPVEWATPDPLPFTITSVSSPAGGPAFDSGTLGRSSRFRFVPTVPGTWEYEDRLSGLRARLTAN